MRFAITVWGNRVSPVFEAACALLFVDFRENELVEQVIVECQQGNLDEFIANLQAQRVQLLLCGAICHDSVNRLEASGVEVAPFLTGEVGQIVDSFIAGEDLSSFAMPGCINGRCCRGSYKHKVNLQ